MPLQFLLLIYALLAAALLGFMLLERSRLGVIFRMIGEDATLAALARQFRSRATRCSPPASPARSPASAAGSMPT